MYIGAMNEIICYGQVRTATSIQEHYESASRHAGRRARELRKSGFGVVVSSLGPQVTNVGTVRMTMITILNPSFNELPPVRIERI